MAITACGPNCTSENKRRGSCGDPQVTYAGAVLDTYERNGYHDSDFFAVVWDAEAGGVRSILTHSTAWWSGHSGAVVDATEEAWEAARAAILPKVVEALRKLAEEEAVKPYVDRRVRSLTTRGKNKGVEGVVRWYGEDRYRPTYRDSTIKHYRVGIAVEGEEKLRYLPVESVEVIDPASAPSDEVLTEEARRRVSTTSGRNLINQQLVGLNVYI